MKLKIKVFGYRGLFNVTERIEANLINNFNCILVEENPDLLIELNLSPSSQAENFYNNCEKKPVRLYELLDIDPNKPIEWYDKVKKDLNSAEIPCVLTDTVRQDVRSKLGIDNLSLLPYPIRNINYQGEKDRKGMLWSGRLYSPNKRFMLAYEFLKYLGLNNNDFFVVGTEKPPCGTFLCAIHDYDLNYYFNRSLFLLSPSSSEGLNLNLIQAVISRCIPIICNDCSVNFELGLKEFVCDPTPMAMADKYYDFLSHYDRYISILDELAPTYEKFTLNGVCKKIIELYSQHVLACPS